jgi:hypothetical protein
MDSPGITQVEPTLSLETGRVTSGGEERVSAEIRTCREADA